MQFEEGHIYHIYNQGNNRQKIFFERENYLFFSKEDGRAFVTSLQYFSVVSYA